MSYLIDGYNLLHALGILQGRTGPQGLEKARNRLIGLLRGSLGSQAPEATVVFDAANAPPGIPAEQESDGLKILFAVERDQADDLIEDMIQGHSDPRHLTVVSDDHRIQRAARRRQCIVRGCIDFLEELHEQRRARLKPTSEASEKAEHLSSTEVDQWLREFADLDNDPGFKELFDPLDFGDSQ